MTDFHDPDAPTPEFQASLKRELRRAYRAERSFGSRRAARWGRVGTMVGLAAGAVMCLTIGLVLGAVTGYASAAGLGERPRAVESASVTARQQFATARLTMARANYNTVQRDFLAGKADSAALQKAKQEVDSMEANAARVEVDVAARNVPAPAPSGLSLLKNPVRTALTALSCGAAATSAQTAPPPQGVPIVTVSAVAAKTTSTLGAVLGVRELPGGRLLVNDAGRRQIKIFDPSLASATVAQDSVPGNANSYGERAANIVRYLGDSTLFTEVVDRDVLVLDRNGQVTRAMSTPTFQDGDIPFAVPFPMPRAIDDKGRLLGEGGFRVRAGGLVADSTLVYRADLDSRKVDLIGTVHYGTGSRNRNDPPENGIRVVTTIHQPVPTEDSWTALSDGTIAFVRGRDYHVDWILPDGTKSATGKLPFDWKRLTDEDKQKLVDSAKVVWDSLMVIRNARNAPRSAGRGGEPGAPTGGMGRSGGGAPTPEREGSIQHMISVPLSEIPDFYPPIRRNSAMADLDGNLWILPTTSAQSQHGELVYDVVNPTRGLFERVRIPLGRSIAGFGMGGVVYLQSGDRTNGFYLERVKLETAK